MQAVAVILALAVLAGCDARAIPSAAETWEVSINNFFEKVVDFSQQTNEMVQHIQTSQFRTELDAAIADSMAELAKYKQAVEAKIMSLNETLPAQMAQDFDLHRDRLQKELQEIKERILVYKDELNQNTGNIPNHMEAYLRRLKKRLNRDIEEFCNTVATYMGEMQSRASQNLDAARKQVEPYLHDSMDVTSERMAQVSSALRTQAEQLGQQLESQAEGLKTQLEATGQEMRTFLEGMMDRLNAELPSIATQVREKLDEIVEKVKETASA